MPELPEVEVVRRGVDRWATRRVITHVEVLHPRAARRSEIDVAAALPGHAFACASRRGKYLWLPLDEWDSCLVMHLGMSGQLLMQPAERAPERHLRARIAFDDSGPELRFVDQRTFGSMMLDALVPDDADGRIPRQVQHIARDPLDPLFDDERFITRLRSRQSEVKRLLLDQALVSGIGNIYADEALWRARLRGTRPGVRVSRSRAAELLGHVREVMTQALAQGGTSFDSLYVNVNGESGYFSRSLHAYGREGQPCVRCGSAIVREPFMGRSSFRCPRCQRT